MCRTKWIWMSFSLIAAACLWAACGTDDPGEKGVTNCAVDSDCPAGEYCNDDDECAQDCDPQSANPGCPTGQSCDSTGRCVGGGECTADGDCDSPPAPRCEDSFLVSAEGSGECNTSGDENLCEYNETRESCSFGCSNGACLPDPCDNKVCADPPDPTCEGDTRVFYSGMGTCQSDGTCDYTRMTEQCALGCANGACESGPCENQTCDTPPSDECVDNVATTYAQTGTCMEDEDMGTVCNYDKMFENCSYTGATCNNAACENPITQVGGVVIVEYQANPGSSVDSDEWFEILNVSGSTIDLNGWKIRSREGTDPKTHNISGIDPNFADGDRYVFANSADLGDNDSITTDYDFTDGVSAVDRLHLSNDTDYIELLNGNDEVVDRVFWEPGAIMTGRSRKLDPTVTPTADANDDFSQWCPSLDDADQYETSPANWGTPGTANSSCADDACGAWNCDRPDDFCLDEGKALQYQVDTAMCESSRFNNPFCDFQPMEVNCQNDQLCALGVCETIPSNLPAAGDVIFTEVMANPSSPVSDSDGEWVELYNTTGNDLSLFSLVFTDNESGGSNDSHTFLDINATIPADSYVVLARNPDANENGGISGAIPYTGSHLKNSPDASFEISLTLHDGTVIDTPFYGNISSGASLQLSSDALDATSNDEEPNWCAGTDSYGSDGQLGTPGAANNACQ